MNPKSLPEAGSPPRTWPPEQGQWTYEDWLRLPDDGFRYEVLNGELFMAPPPNISHQRFSSRLVGRMISHATENGLGEVFHPPTGVRLPGQPVPVQPDIVFVSRERKSIIGKEYIEGAPDLVVEILSPSNWPYDRNQKFQAYRQAGVREYWIVDPRARTVEVYVLEDGSFALTGSHKAGETIRAIALEGFEIAVDEIFSE